MFHNSHTHQMARQGGIYNLQSKCSHCELRNHSAQHQTCMVHPLSTCGVSTSASPQTSNHFSSWRFGVWCDDRCITAYFQCPIVVSKSNYNPHQVPYSMGSPICHRIHSMPLTRSHPMHTIVSVVPYGRALDMSSALLQLPFIHSCPVPSDTLLCATSDLVCFFVCRVVHVSSILCLEPCMYQYILNMPYLRC